MHKLLGKKKADINGINKGDKDDRQKKSNRNFGECTKEFSKSSPY